MMVDRQRDRGANQSDPGSSIAGGWSPQWSVWEEVPTPADDLRDVTLTFGNGVCEVRRGEAPIRCGTYSTDSTQSPKTIDVRFTESDVPELIGATLRGIYEVHGEYLQIGYGPPGGHRAGSFSAERGSGQYLAKYRRNRP